MKAALFFRLPEDQEDFNSARLGAAYKCVVQEMDSYLRNRLKYEELANDTRDALQAARNELTALTNACTSE